MTKRGKNPQKQRMVEEKGREEGQREEKEEEKNWGKREK